MFNIFPFPENPMGRKPKATPQDMSVKLQEILAEKARDVLGLIFVLLANMPRRNEDIEAVVDASIVAMGDVASHHDTEQHGNTERSHRGQEQERRFAAEEGITRPPYEVNLFNIFASFFVFALIEGGLAGTAYVADGKFGYVAGYGYAAVFSVVVYALGFLMGWLPLRHAFYRVNSTSPSPIHGLIRKVAVIGCGICSVLLLLVVFASARTRATGSHKGIWDFSEVGFFQTFNDGLAVLIFAISLIGAVVAIYKGLTAFDPIVSYGMLGRRLRQQPYQAAEDARDQALEDVQELFDDAAEQVDEANDKADRALAAFNADKEPAIAQARDQNGKVADAQAEIERLAISEAKEARFIRDGTPRDVPITVDVSALTDPLSVHRLDVDVEIERLNLTRADIIAGDLKIRLTAAKADAEARINQAFADFKANHESFFSND